MKIPHLSYPVALARIFDAKEGIAVAGSHGKSTTTAILATILAGSRVGGSAIVGTQVPTLGGVNYHVEESENFVIEACEYKRSFLNYHPYISIITNIDLDHLDYYKNLEDYISAFQSLVDQTRGFVIISEDDHHSSALQIPIEKKIIVGKGRVTYFPRVEENCCGEKKVYYTELFLEIPEFSLQVPGEHIHHDACLAYAAARLLGLKDEEILPKLASYVGSWRRSEIVKTTEHGNILISDYGHHPSEIRPTLQALREKYPNRSLYVVFQPHQYSRTRELLHEFAGAFGDANTLVIPNIYFSRDKQEDVEYMTVGRLIMTLEESHPNVINGGGLEHTAELI